MFVHSVTATIVIDHVVECRVLQVYWIVRPHQVFLRLPLAGAPPPPVAIAVPGSSMEARLDREPAVRVIAAELFDKDQQRYRSDQLSDNGCPGLGPLLRSW
jgi:hypothetical protein